MNEDNTMPKTKDVLPPFDPPADELSLGEMLLLYTPVIVFGILTLNSLLASNSQSDDTALRGMLCIAFAVVAAFAGRSWREVRQLRQELEDTQQQLAEVQDQHRHE